VPVIHIPVPQLPVVHHVTAIKPKPKPLVLSPFVYVPAVLYPILAVVPPPIPTAIRPTPPSGTAQVPTTQAVPEEQEEEERATEHVHNMAAYSHTDEGPMPAWPLGLVLILLAAGVAFRPNGKQDKQVYAREYSD
jgi:hypothetical protein